ncbi:Chromatin modification-related protein EAF1 [Daldinia childiae]|uniref:Chromatin modification-related protein EAF1 n=1 Tax=Daldinia childiae TaxID=326645 RepID=UPI0014467A72|nr:Chromatin modification-related protein EAF1 [Daldinia childiae]KAF3065330.1 Chromatin modification-related protein EAF1 [Daldinia childiae]
MKWMRTDFREERKWKMAAARNLAYACAEWVSASIEDRKTLQVDVIIPPKAPPVDTGEVIMGDVHNPQSSDSQPTPDLIPSADMDSPMEPDDEPHEGILDTVAPSAIFALENDDIVFALHQSPTADRLLEELPIYGSPLKVPKSDLTAPEYDPDASWRRPALPLSKFVEGRMELAPIEPPKKRSRYNYAQEDDEDDGVVFGQLNSSQPRLEPESPDVALFRPENKSFRDRLHAGHQFRPPNEHSMPFQSFYECRSPSQWIQSEDDELKSLVREYSYNWSLISSILSSKSLFSSGAERRTPWECFERWVMLEGLPHDMQKTQYFKLWQGRIESSQQVIRQHQNAMQQQAQQQQQQQQANSNGPVTPIPKRRYNVPLKVERRRNQKHLTMIDAMRKLAKKRETAIQKQQHAASLAATRKPNETPQQRAPTKTPREYSIMRFERDQAMAERLAERMAQQQRHEAQRRAVLQRAQQGQVAQMAAAQNVNQLPQNNPQMSASHPHAAMARVGAPSQIPINSQGRPRMPMHATPNGTGTSNHMSGGLVPPMPMNGTSQVQMPTVNGQSRMAMPTAQPDIQLLMQAQQISEQQRRSVQMRQQQQQQQQQHQQQQQSQTPQGSMPLQSSPPAMRAAAMNGLNQKSYLTNAQAQAMMAQFNAGNGSGMSTPPAPGLPMTSQAGSPRPNTTIPQPTHQTYVSQLQHIESQIRQQHPNTPQDMVREMARQLLNTRHNNHNLAQSAMNAAAGATGHAAAANGPHQYAQLLRAQQQQQAAAAAAAQAQQAQQAQAQAQAQHGVQQQQQRNSSGSATPTPSVPK